MPAKAASSARPRGPWPSPSPGWRWRSASPTAPDARPASRRQPRQHIEERAHVGRLFLHPDDIARAGWRASSAVSSASGKGIELFDEDDRGRGVFPLFPLDAQFVADLAGAEHDATRVHRFRVRESPAENCLCVKSSSGEDASGCRSMLLGVNTTSGLRQCRSACRRSRWKYCAAFDGWQIWKLSRAASCRKRSMRALECSGPWPS